MTDGSEKTDDFFQEQAVYHKCMFDSGQKGRGGTHGKLVRHMPGG